MCGIIGISNRKDHSELARAALKSIDYRGKDGSDYYSKDNLTLGHCLHSIVGSVKQPILSKTGKSVLASNCEIYNWKELCKKYKINANNDSDLLLQLLDIKDTAEVLQELDGVYAFAYLKDNKLVLARDIMGVKPLWFSHSDGFCFASERKALEKIGIISSIELNPRKILIYDIKANKIELIERPFFSTLPEIKYSKDSITKEVTALLSEAVKKRVPERKFGLLFSGGIDSSMIALLLKKLGCDFTCYTAVIDSPSLKEPEDLIYSQKAAKSLGLNLKIIKIKESQVEDYLKRIVPLIEDSNVIKVGVALPFFAACEQAKKDGCKVIFSGLGSEEIFAGYERHKKSSDINKECVSGLLKMYERDLYRDDIVTMFNNIELRLPFLDKKLVEYSLRIPAKYKISGERTKAIFRDSALASGLPKEFAERKKKAAQYGSNVHKAIRKISKNKGFALISDYLRQFYPKHNVLLGALVSSGKDSIYALNVMQKQNYKIGCMITLKSENPDSFMFHTPGIEMVKLQSESLGIPLVEQITKGEKEKELDDLKKAMQKAKDKYMIEGIVTGALFSTYQRERIEKIADSLGLKIFSPLWHMDQETELRQIINSGFEFMITKVSAEGLDKSWLNRVITEKDVDRLVQINRKVNINIAFEGGEAETLMIDGPIFTKRIKIVRSEIREESKNIAELIINKAELVGKEAEEEIE